MELHVLEEEAVAILALQKLIKGLKLAEMILGFKLMLNIMVTILVISKY